MRARSSCGSETRSLLDRDWGSGSGMDALYRTMRHRAGGCEGSRRNAGQNWRRNRASLEQIRRSVTVPAPRERAMHLVSVALAIALSAPWATAALAQAQPASSPAMQSLICRGASGIFSDYSLDERIANC